MIQNHLPSFLSVPLLPPWPFHVLAVEGVPKGFKPSALPASFGPCRTVSVVCRLRPQRDHTAYHRLSIGIHIRMRQGGDCTRTRCWGNWPKLTTVGCPSDESCNETCITGTATGMGIVRAGGKDGGVGKVVV